MEPITDINGSFQLHNGVFMPYLGLGVWQAGDGAEVEQAVTWALEAGYRHIDTASIYQNESGVGKALNSSGIPRDALFVVSKVWNSDQGYDSTLSAYQDSLDRLGLDYLDLYLVHWPVAGKYKDTWRAMEELYHQKKVRAIGVSNFLRHHLEDLQTTSRITPMVNQMEFHPYLAQPELLQYCRNNGIQYEAWSPLMQGKVFSIGVFEEMASKYGKTIAQIVLRWDLQKGVITIPKSVRKDRIASNAALFDFELSDSDMALLDAQDRGKRFGPDPDSFDF